MTVLRSLLFYAAFYGGSIYFISFGVLAMPFRKDAAITAARGWSCYHRACMKRFLGIDVRIEGQLAEGPVLYAVKHEAFFEAIDMPCLLPGPVGFAKEELFRIPGWGLLARAHGMIPVARDQGASALRFMLSEARRHAKDGRPLVIFPEGTRVPHGTCPPLKSGFAGLYKMLGLPVIPVAINSGPLYHRRWKRPGIITFRFGEVIPPGLAREEAERRVHAGINALNQTGPA